MPNWKKVIVSGSSAELTTLNLSSVSNAGTDTDKFLVLDAAGNVDYRTGTQVLSDIGGLSSGGEIVASVQTYVDFKSQTQGGLPWGGSTDLMPIDRWMGVWIAPSSGYIEKIYVSPENANSPTGTFSIQMYNNALTQGTAVTNSMGSPGTNVQFNFGSPTYAFSAGDRIYLDLNKSTNSCDFYAVQVVFRLDN